MSDTIKKLLLCTSGMVLSVCFTALALWLQCYPFPCKGANGVARLPMLLAVIVLFSSCFGFAYLAYEWWKKLDK